MTPEELETRVCGALDSYALVKRMRRGEDLTQMVHLIFDQGSDIVLNVSDRDQIVPRVQVVRRSQRARGRYLVAMVHLVDMYGYEPPAEVLARSDLLPRRGMATEAFHRGEPGTFEGLRATGWDGQRSVSWEVRYTVRKGKVRFRAPKRDLRREEGAAMDAVRAAFEAPLD